MDRLAPFDKIGVSPTPDFLNADPASGVPGSIVNAIVFNALQHEVVNAITGFGLTPDAGNYSQLLQAIQAAAQSFTITTAITKTVHGSGADFVDLNAAFAWLSQRRIAKSGSVTFNVAAGTYSYGATAVNYYHPDGDRVFVNAAALTGAFPVFADYTTTGVTLAARTADKATNLAMLRTKYATEIQFTGTGLLAINGNLGGLTNLLVTSDGTGTDGIAINAGAQRVTNVVSAGAAGRGIVVFGGAYLTASAIHGVGCGQYGISAEEGGQIAAFGENIGAGCGATGIYAWNTGSIISQAGGTLKAKGNASNGIAAYLGATIHCGTTAASRSNGINGFAAFYKSIVIANGADASQNGGNGFTASDTSEIECTSSTSAFGNNGGYAYAATYISFMNRTSGTGTGSTGTATPAPGTSGNLNSYML